MKRLALLAAYALLWPAIRVLRVLDDMVLTYDWEDEA